MSIDRLSFLLSQLETVLNPNVLSDSNETQIVEDTLSSNLLKNLKQELQEQAEELQQQLILAKPERINLTEMQQSLQSLVSALPIEIAIVDQQMRYIAMSDRWLQNHQLIESDIINRTLYESFPDLPPSWYQEHQNCLAGKVQSLKQEQDNLSWNVSAWQDSQSKVLGLILLSQINIEHTLLKTKLESSEAQMRAVFSGMNELVFTIEIESNTILILPTNFFELYDNSFLNQVINETHIQIFNSPEAENYQTLIHNVLQSGRVNNFEYSLSINNFQIHFSVNVAPVSATTVILVARDITERKEKERDNLFVEKELAQVTLQSIGDAVITTNNLGKVEYLNPIAEQLTGWQAEMGIGKDLALVFPILAEKTRKPIVNSIQKIVRQNRVCKLNAKNLLLARNGNEYAIEGLASPIKDRHGKLMGAVIVFRDVTESRRMARRLSWQATHDPLTNLCNRRKFETYLTKAINDAAQNKSHHALCLLDLDRFKIVNDTCGHAAGDELLRQITKLLQKRIRTSDIFARIGGDEFG